MTEPKTIPYKKREGTSGIEGHWYETKLLSLIYFRAIHDDNVEAFYLATNVDKLGSFDDICFRAKVQGIDKPLSVFIQAKHRENTSTVMLNNNSDWLTYFESYLEVRGKFKYDNEHKLFDGTFEGTECLFVFYTTAKIDRPTRKYEGSIAHFLNKLIGTYELCSGLQPLNDTFLHEELNQVLLEKEMKTLAEQIAKCIYGKFDDAALMQQELVNRYHVILAQQVFDVSKENNEGRREIRFRQDFFDITEEPVQIFKEELCAEILKRKKFVSGDSETNFLDSCLACCSVVDKDNDPYHEIKRLITYKNRKFDIPDKTELERYRPFLDKINESQETKRKTLERAVKDCMPSLKFKGPASFGNKDLTIKGEDARKERRLVSLTKTFVELIEKSTTSNIVLINEESALLSKQKGFVEFNGGIASAVGNLLVLDDETNLLKFNDNYKSLGKLAKKLFDLLNDKIENLCEYKLDVRAKKFPKLSFVPDEYTANIVRDFYNRLLIYTSQAKESKVEKMLISEIKEKLRHRDDVHTRNNKSNSIFLNYHKDMENWWADKKGKYLTKESRLYDDALRHALSQPLVSHINMMQSINSKNYTFSEDAVNSIKLDNQRSGTVIVTNNIALTVAKLMNHLIKKDCVVLDIQYIFNLALDKTLQTELVDLKTENTFIVICEKAIFDPSSDQKKVAVITNCIKDVTAIIILNDQDSVENARKYFKLKDNVIKDKRNNLIDLSQESQESILENTNVIFQGVDVCLRKLVDEKSLGLVEELVLYKLMQHDKNVIGKPVTFLNYKENIYIERSVKLHKVITQALDTSDRKLEEGDVKRISKLNDLEDDVVLVIGDPGIGKSTLLTQLSLKTKQMDSSVWILRINLLEYSKTFYEWQDNGTVIDTLKCLQFLCQVAHSEENIKNIEITLDDIVSLKDCGGDEWAVFELKMFLHHYNTKQIIILFDGFDEICPTYAYEVLSLIKAVMNLRQKHKIWITSRSYDRIVTELELQFLYKIEPLNNDEQDLYLSTFWEKKNLVMQLDQSWVRDNLNDFCRFMCKSDDLKMFKKKRHLPDESINEKPLLAVYISLFKYLTRELTHLGFMDFYYEPTLQYNGLVATPLHLSMLAEHLYNQIIEKNNDDERKRNKGDSAKERNKYIEAKNAKSLESWQNLAASEEISLLQWDTESLQKIDEQYIDRNHTPIVWDLDVNIFKIYKRFLKNKLEIRFQKNYKDGIYTPDNRNQFNKQYADDTDKLKILAAYVVYDKRLLDKHELKRCEGIIDKLKAGEENTDIICNVINDIPVFVHSTFAEYFAIEYICDLIKSQRNVKHLFNFILNVMFFKLNKNVLVILDAKIKIDKQLTTVVKQNKGIIFRLLLEQGKNKRGRIKSSLCEAIRLGLRNLAYMLLSTNEDYLYESNLMDFIEIIKETNMLMTAVKMGFDELLIKIINQVRIIRESKLNALFENIEIFNGNENIARENTSELVQKLHANVWTRMDIIPDWENLQELGQIYFI